jgi:hypothetical protein
MLCDGCFVSTLNLLSEFARALSLLLGPEWSFRLIFVLAGYFPRRRPRWYGSIRLLYKGTLAQFLFSKSVDVQRGVCHSFGRGGEKWALGALSGLTGEGDV